MPKDFLHKSKGFSLFAFLIFMGVICLILLFSLFVKEGYFSSFLPFSSTEQVREEETLGDTSFFSFIESIWNDARCALERIIPGEDSLSCQPKGEEPVVIVPTPSPTPSTLVRDDEDVTLSPSPTSSPFFSPSPSPSPSPSFPPPLIVSSSGNPINYYNTYTTQTGVSQSYVDSQINDLQSEISSLRSRSSNQTNRTFDNIGDSLSNAIDDLTDGGAFSNSTLTSATISDSTFSGDSAFDGDTLVVDSVNGRVGIGTSSPTDALSVNGSIFLADTSPTLTANRLYANGGDLFFAGNLIAGATTGNWASDGTSAWRATGNVGIGTTTPTAKLTVAGGILADYFNATATATASTFEGGLNVNKDIVMGGVFSQVRAVQGKSLNLYGGSGSLGGGEGGSVVLVAGDAQVGNNSGGDVDIYSGFGHNTGAGGVIALNSSNNIFFNAPNGGIQVYGDLTPIFDNFNTLGSASRIWSNIYAYKIGNLTSDGCVKTTNGDGTLAVSSCGVSSQWTTNGSDIHYNTGNVGIGTVTPTDQLVVKSTSAADTGISIINTNSSGTMNLNFNYINDGGVNDTNIGRIWASANGNELYIGTGRDTASAGIVFKSSVNTPASYDTELMRITNGGNVGIGTSSPLFKLSVQNAGEGNTLQLFDTDGNCLLDPDSGGITTTCSSDSRLKSNITNAGSVLSYLANIPIKDYTVIASGERRTGVVAQDLLENYADLVSMGADGYYGVKEINSWKLLKGIQEQQTEISSLASSTQDLSEKTALFSLNLEGNTTNFELLTSNLASTTQTTASLATSIDLTNLTLADARDELDLLTTSTSMLSSQFTELERQLSALVSSSTFVSADENPTFQSRWAALVLDAFKALGAKIENGIASFKKIVVEKLHIGTTENPSGIVMYGEDGVPYCLRLLKGGVASTTSVDEEGECPAFSQTDADETPTDADNSSAMTPSEVIVPLNIQSSTKTTTTKFEEENTLKEEGVASSTPILSESGEEQTDEFPTDTVSSQELIPEPEPVNDSSERSPSEPESIPESALPPEVPDESESQLQP